MSRLTQDDLTALDVARDLLASRVSDLDPTQFAALAGHLRVLAEAGLARHSDGTLNAGALAEAARLAVVISTAPAVVPDYVSP